MSVRLLLALALATVLATAGLMLLSMSTRAALRQLRTRLFRGEVLIAEGRRLQRADAQLADAQRVAEALVAGGTQGVRAIHHGIAAVPFGVLEAIPATRPVTRVVRASHDLIADAVYGTVDAVNRGVGAGLRAALRARVARGAADSGRTLRHDAAAPADDDPARARE